MFQEDIFPDTYAGIPALTATEYFEGKNKEPATVSMKPGAAHAGGGAQPVFTAAKSASQLQKELDEMTHKYEEAMKLVTQLKSRLGEH